MHFFSPVRGLIYHSISRGNEQTKSGTASIILMSPFKAPVECKMSGHLQILLSLGECRKKVQVCSRALGP